MRRSVSGKVMCVMPTHCTIITEWRNTHRFANTKDLVAGEDVHLYFDKKGVLKDVVPLRYLEEHEIPPEEYDPELSADDYTVGVGLGSVGD